MSEHPVVSWSEAGATHSARWRSERGASPPRRVVIADERMNTEAAYRHACEGVALLWRGDFQNARHLLQALACARENIARLGLAGQVEVAQADLFPEGRAKLIVCNPPWIPARPSSPLEHAICEPDSRMLRGFIGGLAAHLEPGGESWLVLSDIAEHLGLRSRADLLAAFDAAGLRVAGRTSVRPHHPRVADAADPLHAARAAEVTSLWRLVVR